MSPTDTLDLAAVKQGQQAMWQSGDYGAIAAQIHVVAERLVDSVNPPAGSSVLDVAGGTGNAAIAAARSNTVVTCTDYAPSLLDRARERAAAEHLEMAFEVADAEALPYDDASYDVVLSVFGAMFAPDQAQTARELARVTRSGGLIGIAAWTPEGFLGDWFRATAKHAPPPQGLASPLRWGTEDGFDELFGEHVSSVYTRKCAFTWRYPDAQTMVDQFRHVYGPTVKAFATVGEDGAAALEAELIATVERSAHRRGNAITIPAEYLEVVAVRR